MKFLQFIKRHWKVASILVAIAIATTIGVVVVSAANISTGSVTDLVFDASFDYAGVSTTIPLSLTGSISGSPSWSFEMGTGDVDN